MKKLPKSRARPVRLARKIKASVLDVSGYDFPSFVRIHRRAAGLTQNALSKEMGIAESAVQALEIGGSTPQPENIPTLAKAIKADPMLLAERIESWEKLKTPNKRKKVRKVKKYVRASKK